MNSALSIGEAARRTGCSVATIRFYEEMGLIPEAGRTAGGRRVFTRPGVERLRLIRRLRSMEFSIEAIKERLEHLWAHPDRVATFLNRLVLRPAPV